MDRGFRALDHNTSERTTRPIAIGRETYLFLESESEKAYGFCSIWVDIRMKLSHLSSSVRICSKAFGCFSPVKTK